MAINEGIEAVKTRRKPPEKVRAARLDQQAATQNNLHSKAYLNAKSKSSLKILIGGLLLFGNKNQKAFWPVFDAILRQYIDLRRSERIR